MHPWDQVILLELAIMLVLKFDCLVALRVATLVLRCIAAVVVVWSLPRFCVPVCCKIHQYVCMYAQHGGRGAKVRLYVMKSIQCFVLPYVCM